MADRETVGVILSRNWQLLSENAAAVAITVVVLAAIDALTNHAPYNLLVSSVASFAAYFVNLNKALHRLGRDFGGRGRPAMGALIGLNFLTGLGIMIGFVLLVVPGIVLAVRWSIAGPILLGDDKGVSEAIADSWEETAGRFWPIFGAGVVIIVLGIVTVVLLVALFAAVASLLGTSAAMTEEVVVDIAVQAFMVSLWYQSVAIYALKRSPTEELQEVFA
jgi:hypothetical protein